MNIAIEAWLFWLPVGMTLGILGTLIIDSIIEGRTKR